MAYVSTNYAQYDGQVVGTGQCVDYVKTASDAPATSQWGAGAAVKGNASLAAGTAIATFQNGVYANDTHGNSHAAIYVSQDANGITVHDQWVGQPVHSRVIRFRGGATTPNNDGDAFSVIS